MASSEVPSLLWLSLFPTQILVSLFLLVNASPPLLYGRHATRPVYGEVVETCCPGSLALSALPSRLLLCPPSIFPPFSYTAAVGWPGPFFFWTLGSLLGYCTLFSPSCRSPSFISFWILRLRTIYLALPSATRGTILTILEDPSPPFLSPHGSH